MDITQTLTKTQVLIKTDKQAEFEQFKNLLLEYNQRYNLTTIIQDKDIFYKHFLDSSAGFDLFHQGASVAEIG